MKTFSFLPAATLALASFCSLSSAQTVWVVQESGGTGVDFTALDTAVDTASDGDTILLRNGFYPDLVIGSKGLRVIADTGHAPVLGKIVVRNQTAGQFCSLVGLKVLPAGTPGMRIKDSFGGVWIEDCILNGSQGNPSQSAPVYHAEGYAGLNVLDSSFVNVLNSTLVGGNGMDSSWPAFYYNGFGGPGARLEGVSDVVFQGSTLTGGFGGSSYDDDEDGNGGAGGDGVFVHSGSVEVLGCQLIGGAGGSGGSEYHALIDDYSCGWGGSSGNGVGANPETSTSVSIDYASLTFSTGPVGAPGMGFCQAGTPGVPVLGFGATTAALGMVDTDLAFSTPVRVGGNVSVHSSGPAGSLRVLLLSGAPTWQNQFAVDGLQLVDLSNPFVMPLIGFPDNFVAPANLALPAGTQVTLLGQLLVFDPVTSNLTLGDVASLTLLDAAL